MELRGETGEVGECSTDGRRDCGLTLSLRKRGWEGVNRGRIDLDFFFCTIRSGTVNGGSSSVDERDVTEEDAL